jgi:uncharacterized protein YggE
VLVPSQGQEIQNKNNQITVLGSVELKEVADQASFTFSVKGVGSTLRLAVGDANIKVKAITDKLLKIHIPANKIATSQFYSGENYGDQSFWSSKRDYRAVLVTLVTIDSLRMMDSILYTVSEGEIENISDITFALKDELGLRRKARTAAALKAKEKAEDIANALRVTLGQVVFVEETEPTRVGQRQNQVLMRGAYAMAERNYPNPYNPPSYSFVPEQPEVDESRGSGFFAQTISVTSQVRATFEIKR